MASYLGNKCEIYGSTIDYCKDFYEGLLREVLEERAKEAGQDPNNHLSYIQNCIDWVRSTDFYDAPASTRFHESFPHGLLYHTLKVYNEVIDFLSLPKFQSVSLSSATLVALCHDWCKINLYEKYLKNVKDEETGQWVKEAAYRFKQIDHPFGHGVASMYMAMKLFKLSEEEALAIRWHQGKWHVDDAYQNDFQEANETYPLVHLIQFADQLAIVQY